jgi:imidazole glycerol-phosphate synthase subunit HisF
MEKPGAREIVLTSKDADSTSEGYDREMTRAVAEAVKIPTTASGGAEKPRHPYEAVTIGKGSAIATASIFHFGEIPINKETTWFVSKLGT